MNRRALTAILVSTCITGCSSAGQQNGSSTTATDDHFTCAAIIGAADRLISTARIAPDAAISRDGLLAGMTHLNAWAIPKNLPEKQAFDEVNVERDRLVSSLSPSEIAKRAHTCIDQVKAANGG
jgi:hypothetical protein